MFERDGRTHAVGVRCRFQANDGTALASAAIDGAGIALAGEDVLSQPLDDGRLVRVLMEYRPPSRPMHLLWSPDQRQTPKLRSFIDAAIAHYAPSPWPEPDC